MKFYNQEKSKIITKVEIYETTCGSYQKGEVDINSKKILVDIADDVCKRKLGLSGRTSLNGDTGMLFFFEKEGNYGFWMENMNFPIDILWISSSSKVIGIEKNLATSTYPKSFGTKYFSQYVLEVPAGYLNKNNIKVGDTIIFKKK
jgi:uncharacterized membrane protein (UPF0127 family)